MRIRWEKKVALLVTDPWCANSNPFKTPPICRICHITLPWLLNKEGNAVKTNRQIVIIIGPALSGALSKLRPHRRNRKNRELTWRDKIPVNLVIGPFMKFLLAIYVFFLDFNCHPKKNLTNLIPRDSKNLKTLSIYFLQILKIPAKVLVNKCKIPEIQGSFRKSQNGLTLTGQNPLV